MPQVHRVDTAIPVIEIPYDGDRKRIGGPYGEIDAFYAVEGTGVRTHLLIDAVVLALPKQIQVEFAKNGKRILFWCGGCIGHIVMVLRYCHSGHPCWFNTFYILY